MRVGGVYRIVAPDGRFYIGSSAYIKQRWSHHRGAMRAGKHGARKLQAVADEFGVDALQFEVIVCAIDKAALPDLEQAFIDELKPSLNTLRQARTAMHDEQTRAKASATARVSERHIAARTENQRKAAAGISRRIVRLTDGVVFASSYEAARACDMHHKDSMAAAANKGWRCAGHYWAWEGSGVTLQDREIAAAAAEQLRRLRSAARMTETTRRPVVRAVDGSVFPSIAEAARQCKCHHTAIQRAVTTGMRANGSHWTYAPR